MLCCRKKGFTLVELMVVIAIIGILAAALVAPVSNARTTGRAVRCKANLKNLAQASMSYAVDRRSWPRGVRHLHERLPSAGTYEVLEHDGSSDQPTYHVYLGWVSGYYGGSLPWPQMAQPLLKKDADERASYFFFDESSSTKGSKAYISITNGVLWSYVGRDLGAYVCDEHKSAARAAGCNNVMRSYVMNAYFGANLKTSFASTSATVPRDREGYRRLDNLARRGSAADLLLFAELPAFSPSGERQVVKTLAAADGILDVQIIGYSQAKPANEEFIGFNHVTGKRRVAHVAFADGHVDVVIAPQNASKADLQDLTFLMCNGLEVPPSKNDWKTARSEFK